MHKIAHNPTSMCVQIAFFYTAKNDNFRTVEKREGLYVSYAELINTLSPALNSLFTGLWHWFYPQYTCVTTITTNNINKGCI